jgi:hypothetical protein
MVSAFDRLYGDPQFGETAVSGPCKLDGRNEEQALPIGLVGKHVDERLLGLCSRGIELDRLVQLAASKAPEDHARQST